MSRQVLFQPNLRFENDPGSKIVNRRRLRETPNLWSFPIEEARELAKGALSLALQRMELDTEFQEKIKLAEKGTLKAYVDSWYTKTTDGQVPSPYGVHVDGSYKKLTAPGLERDLERLGKNPDSRMFLMTFGDMKAGNANPLFINTPFYVNESDLSEDNTFADLHKASFQRIGVDLAYVRPEPGTLCIYNGNSPHTAMPTRIHRGTDLERALVRVSFLPHEYPYARSRKRHSEVPLYYPNL